MKQEYIIIIFLVIATLLFCCKCLGVKKEGFSYLDPTTITTKVTPEPSVQSDQVNSDHLANTVPPFKKFPSLKPHDYTYTSSLAPNPTFVGSELGDSQELHPFIEKAYPRKCPVIIRSRYHPSQSAEAGLSLKDLKAPSNYNP